MSLLRETGFTRGELIDFLAGGYFEIRLTTMTKAERSKVAKKAAKALGTSQETLLAIFQES